MRGEVNRGFTVFRTWLEEMFISRDMRGVISLLNVYCGVEMIEGCLWSKNLRFNGFSGRKPPSNRQGPDHWCFSLLPLLRIMKRVTGVKQ